MSLRKKLLIFFSVMGPGIITANIDNDASGITTYSVIGARFGYSMLWLLIPTTISLAVIQEMVARMGAVTGKGLSDLIREHFGVKAAFYMMLALFFANFGNTVADFAGWAASWEVFGVSRYIVVPIGALLVWFLVIKGSYMSVERTLLFACLIYFGYVASAFMAQPKWSEVARSTFIPTVKFSAEWFYLAVAIIGTTITPWMQFYLQSSVAEKGIHTENYGASKIEVILGCVMTDVVSFFIIVACAATLFPAGIRISDASEAAIALRPLAGQYATVLFGFSLANASLLGVIVIPLATAYFICEAMGWERGVNKSFSEAPQFMWIYTIMIVLGALLVLVPGAPLVTLLVASSVINGIVLPFVLVYALSLVNNKKIMGEYVNTRGYNYVAWVTVAVVAVLSGATVLSVAMGKV